LKNEPAVLTSAAAHTAICYADEKNYFLQGNINIKDINKVRIEAHRVQNIPSFQTINKYGYIFVFLDNWCQLLLGRLNRKISATKGSQNFARKLVCRKSIASHSQIGVRG
jgi:hypothetical protein